MTREELGLPARWSTVLGWLLFCGKTVLVEVAKFCVKPLKHKYLPRQMDYRKGMNDEFWKLFPFRDIPLRAETNIDTEMMGKVIEEGREKMLNSQYIRGQKVLDNLKNGAPACQIKELPAVFCENDESTYENGAILTDTIAEWGVKKFTAGPFDRPPLKQFRVNPLKAIVTDGKIS